MKIKLITQTHIHIGSGDIYRRLFDFVIFRDKFIQINFERIFKYNKNLLSALSQTGNLNWIENGIHKLLMHYDDIRVRVININLGRMSQDILNNIQEVRKFAKHIEGKDKCYIPGSSIKGLLRTATLYYILKNNQSLLNNYINTYLSQLRQSKNIFNALRAAETTIFGDSFSDPFRYLIVEDSEEIKDENFEIICISRDNHTIFAEALKPNFEISIEIKNVKEFEQEISKKFNLSFNLKDALKVFGRDIYNYEKSILSKRGITIPPWQNIMIKLGFSGRFYSKTIYILICNINLNNQISSQLNSIISRYKKLAKQLSQAATAYNSFKSFPSTISLFNNKPIGWIRIT